MGTLLERTLQEGTLQERTLLESTLLECTLLEGTLLVGRVPSYTHPNRCEACERSWLCGMPRNVLSPSCTRVSLDDPSDGPSDDTTNCSLGRAVSETGASEERSSPSSASGGGRWSGRLGLGSTSSNASDDSPSIGCTSARGDIADEVRWTPSRVPIANAPAPAATTAVSLPRAMPADAMAPVA